MSPGPTMERVYLDLKARIMAGEFAPGSRLDAGQLTGRLVASVTPIRDALHRLSGERLIESWHREGFRQPILTEADLVDLYAWAQALLIFALRSPGAAPAMPERPIVGAGGDDYAGRVARLFRTIALLTANRELRYAIDNMVDRTHLIRVAEARVDPACLSTIGAMEEDFRFERWTALRAKLTRYHRRQSGLAGRLVAELRPREQRL
jgi:hypothetical protein